MQQQEDKNLLNSNPSDEKEQKHKGKADPYRSRGRGRAGRSRGRGSYRSRGGSSKSFRKKEEAEIKPQVGSLDRYSCENLDKLMGDEFPVSSTSCTTVESVMIDVDGYSGVCSSVYKQLMGEEKDITSKLSYSEFMLVMGWVLVKRVFLIRQGFYGEETHIKHLLDSMSDDIKVPGPIAMALDSLGICKGPAGIQYVPDLVLPRYDLSNVANTHGMIPSTSDTKFKVTVPGALCYMYPFGYYMRKIKKELGDRAFQNYWDQRINPARAGNDDVYLVNRRFNPGIARMIDGDQGRRYEYKSADFVNASTVFGSICYNGALLRLYPSFVEMTKKYISYSEVTKSKTSSCAILGFVSHDDNNVFPSPSLHVYSPIILSQWECHAVRLFKWRRTVPNAHASHAASPQWVSDEMLPYLSVRNNEITRIVSDDNMIKHFVSCFIVSNVKNVM